MRDFFSPGCALGGPKTNSGFDLKMAGSLPAQDPDNITVLMLGDEKCGKTTFLSYALTAIRDAIRES